MPKLTLSILAYLAGLGVVSLVVWTENLSWRDDIGIFVPDLLSWLAWLIGWVAWLAVSEVLSRRLGVPAPRLRRVESSQERLAWFVAIVVLAPIVEELIFRGLLYWRISETVLGTVGAIIVGALASTALHLSGAGWGYRIIIAIDGIIYGLARAHTGSVLVPLVLHGVGNLYAFMQRTGAVSPPAKSEPRP